MKAIAFYLPQFHPIPENDAWWGKGFTEWTNVSKAKPLFAGHYQPQIPADLGFYDLRLEETRIAQAELAKKYGINGFCYYHYWFNGKMLLERPFNEVLASGNPDLPFCLCWANENWTRRWDGLEQEILMEQKYDEYDALQHIDWLDRAFSDNRYIRIHGKPLFLIYCAGRITNIKEIIQIWRKSIKDKGYPDIYLCAVKSGQHDMSDNESIGVGFDALVDFQPHYKDFPESDNYLTRQIGKVVNKFIDLVRLHKVMPYRPLYARYQYSEIINTVINKLLPQQKTFPCVFPSWDNSPRKKSNATIIQNNDAYLYGSFLENAFSRVQGYDREEQIVFINAWNEWAEGCHLEPDLKNGNKFLAATKNELNKLSSSKK